MTSGTASPTPNDSPSLLQRPLLMTSREIGLRTTKKTVEFQNVYVTEDDNRISEKWDQETFQTVISDNNSNIQGRRLLQPRMSLLGRPLNYRASRRDARYRRLQSRIYNFLERPRGAAFIYHILVFIMVFAGLALSVFSTIEEYEKTAGDILVYMESLVCVLFSIELILRTWSSGCRSRYQGYMGRIKFLRRPFCVIDIITILASIVVLVLTMKSGGQVLAASALRGLRFFQILRMVRMDRRGGTWKLLGSVVYAHRQELITTLYIGFLGLIFASFLVFLAEKDVPNTKFNNFAQALWWGVITLCTVGYGDMVPFTWQGKIIASFCSLLGISFFALPAGILGSGFALKVQQQQRQKHMIRRRQPAAMLIQSLWRCYAADEKSMSEATWKIHQVPYSPPSRLTSSFRHNASFVGRLSTIRRHRNQGACATLHSPSMVHSRTVATRALNSSNENIGNSSNATRNVLHTSFSEDSAATHETRVTVENQDDDDEEPQLLQLTSRHKGAIRAIRKLKYFVARRKFREALKPYDVKDVIEQYSSGHADLLNRVKNLQYRLDQILGKQDSKSKDVYSSKVCLASRVVKVERQVDDVFAKIDQFFELYMEDRKHFLPSVAHQPFIEGHRSDPFKAKPKSILVEQSSEPNSPITKTIVSPAQTPPTVLRRSTMQRGYSDLGHRIKKRVTLSSTCASYPELEASPLNGSVTLIVPQAATEAESLSKEGSLLISASSTEASTSAQNVSLVLEPGLEGSRTITQSSDDFKNTFQRNEDEREEGIEEEINKRTVLCHAVQSEIIITPTTLNRTSIPDNVYIKNFPPTDEIPYKEH